MLYELLEKAPYPLLLLALGEDVLVVAIIKATSIIVGTFDT